MSRKVEVICYNFSIQSILFTTKSPYSEKPLYNVPKMTNSGFLGKIGENLKNSSDVVKIFFFFHKYFCF